MALIITEVCIGCGACEPECPNNAIYETSSEWAFSDGTKLNGLIEFNGKFIDASTKNKPISESVYFIVPDKCTECIGFHEDPQCAEVCPVDCCVPDPDYVETKEQLLAKKAWLHK